MTNPELKIPSVKQESDNTDWMSDAACKGVDTDIFFEGPLHLAAKFCLTECTVREECYNYAVRNKEESGVWGGVLFRPARKKNKTI